MSWIRKRRLISCTYKQLQCWYDYCDTSTNHYIDVIMTTMASQITSITVVYSTVYSDADQRKHQSSASLAFVWGIHRDRWIPRTKGQLRGKYFHLMTSSWKQGDSHEILSHVDLHSITASNIKSRFWITWISNHNHHKVWGEIIYPFPNFKGLIIELGNR